MFGTELTFVYTLATLKVAMHPAQTSVHRTSVSTGVED
jgi:hypothetical protein